MEEHKITTFTTPILVSLLVVAAFLVGMFWTKIQYLQGEAPKKIAQVSPTPVEEETLGKELVSTVGNFSITGDELCQEAGKPIVYMFGSAGCPHCIWEHPIFTKVTAKFAGLISVHDNMDEQGTDEEIWDQYSEINQGGIPFLVLGGQYARVGSGENAGEVEEEKNLTALICKLTGGEPTAVCDEVSDLVEQIE